LEKEGAREGYDHYFLDDFSLKIISPK